MKVVKYDRVFITLSVCFGLFFFVLNVYTPLIADDFSYSLRVHSVSDIFILRYNDYFHWGGRWIAHFFAQIWLLVGKPFFNVANTIVYCFFLFLVQFHITGRYIKQNHGIFLALNIFFWFFTPAWGQNFIWLTGSCNYLWTTTIILFFLVPFRKRHDNPEYKMNIPLSVLFFFVGIFAGWCNENSGAAVLCLLIAYFITKIFRKDKFAFFEILGAVGFLIGFSLLIAAPGNYARAEVFQQNNWGYSNEPLLLMLFYRSVSITKMFIKNHGLLFVSISFFLGFDLIYHQRRKILVFSYFYFLAVLTGTYSMVLSPAFPDRAFLIVIVFLVISLGSILAQMEFQIYSVIKRNIAVFAIVALISRYLFSFVDHTILLITILLVITLGSILIQMEFKIPGIIKKNIAFIAVVLIFVFIFFPNRAFLIVTIFSLITLGSILAQMEFRIPAIIKRNIAIFAVVVLIGLCFSFLNGGRKILGVYLRWYDRIEYILAEKEKGNLDIEVNPIKATDRHVALYGLSDVLPDKNNWPNTSIASYFGLKSIKNNDELMKSLWSEKRKRIKQLIIPPWKIINKLRDQSN